MRRNLPLSELSSINTKRVRHLACPVDDRHRVLASVTYDLLVKNNLADVPILSSIYVDFIIDNLCVS